MQGIWTHLGRKVVGNLTTVSTSVRDFTVTVLGFHFIEKVLASGSNEDGLPIFLRWEQLAGYARAAINGDRTFRGTERVHRNIEESGVVTLSADRAYQILGSQKIYGLWGLYTVPSRSSGLLYGDPARPTPAAREHAEDTWWPAISKAGMGDGRRIVAILREPRARVDLRGRDADVVATVARMIRRRLNENEGRFYRFHLAEGGPSDSTSGAQKILLGILDRHPLPESESLSPTLVSAWAKEAARDEEAGGHLATSLERIRVTESLLAPSGALFGWLLSQQGRTLDALADELRRQWGPRVDRVESHRLIDLKTDFLGATGSEEAASRWLRIADRFAAGEYQDLLGLLLEQNRWVMSVRNGSSPWAEVRDGRLHVRFRDETGRLPERGELRTLWRYPYFIDSLRIVAATLRESST